MTINVKNNVLVVPLNPKDEWGEEVFGGLARCSDLVAQRKLCTVQHAWQSLAREQTWERLVAQLMRQNRALLKCCVNGWRKMVTVNSTYCKSFSLRCKNQIVDTEKSLQSKLKEKFRNHIYFTNLPGRPNVVCFRDMASYISYEQILLKNPITTDREIASENILKVIRCKCKESDNQCGTNRCSCRKNGSPCFMACGKCHGKECENEQESNV